MKIRMLYGVLLGIILTAIIIVINLHRMSIWAALFVGILAISISVLGQLLVVRPKNGGEED